MNHSIRLLAAFSIISILLSCGCRSKSDVKALSEEDKGKRQIVSLTQKSISEIGLKLDAAEEKTLSGTLTAPARLLPDQDLEAQVGSFVPGRVNKVFVGLGDHVKEGQELMHIEGLEVGEIKAQFIKAKAQYTSAEATLKRQKTLMDQKVGSQKALIEAQAEYDKALAEYSAEDKKIHSIGLTDADVLTFFENPADRHSPVGGILPIKSPITGVIVERNVSIGQLIDVSTNAFKIVNSSTLWADGQLYEKDIPKLKAKSDIVLTVSAFPDRSFSGKIIYIGETLDEQSRTVKVRAEVRNEHHLLKPEMFGEMHIPVKAQERGIAVPAEAVVNGLAGAYVFTALNDTLFEKRDVITGLSFGNFIEIRKGLNKGEKVASKGAFYLKSELNKGELGGGD